MTHDRRFALLGAFALLGCVADNPDFLGPGFDDPVDIDSPHPVWEAPSTSSRWSIGTCAGDEGDDDANWRAGSLDTCGPLGYRALLEHASLDGVLRTVPIPAAGRVTLTMRTRVSLPACGNRALAGGRVVAHNTGFSTEFEFDEGQLPDLDGTGRLLAGEYDWREVSASLELQAAGDIRIAFGIAVTDTECLRSWDEQEPCALQASAPANCEQVRSCCLEAVGAMPVPGGWQIDDLRLEIDP